MRVSAAAALILALAAPVRAEHPDLRVIEAVRQGDRAAVGALLGADADVNARQPDGATALHWAIYLDDLETAKLLLHAGARPDVANELDVTPLYLACENANAALVRLLLEAGAAPDVALPSGETALMTAARTGSAGAVAALVEHGAAVDTRETTEDQTALM
ncbi:MAG: ankyrin repeat domain-containing protein, partial [Acidobacteria bacterium]|nr:ankyrin repeat domain-containing protein [Acidobacteriota bacterium]